MEDYYHLRVVMMVAGDGTPVIASRAMFEGATFESIAAAHPEVNLFYSDLTCMPVEV